MQKEIAKNLAIAFGMGLLASGVMLSAYHFGYVARQKKGNANKKNPSVEDSKKS